MVDNIKGIFTNIMITSLYGARGATAITHTTLPKYICLSNLSASSLVVFTPIEPKNNNFDTTNINQ